MVGIPLLLAAALAARTPVAATAHFAFYSDFETNLNDALQAAGTARRFRKEELFRTGAEVACFEKLPPSTRAGWHGAVDYYQKVVSPGEFLQSPQYDIRLQLAGYVDEKDGVDGETLGITASFRAAAAPAYRACRWTAQDEENRRWIDALRPRLATYESRIAPRLETLYQKKWSALPIAVDVVKTVSWSGANSVLLSGGGGHLLVSTDYHDESALEVVFHEGSHVLMARTDPVWKALDDAARAAGIEPPRDLWHVVLFYTTGESVRRILDEGGVHGYEPMLYGIFGRGAWVEYREPIERAWPDYLDGKKTLATAAADLIRACRK